MQVPSGTNIGSPSIALLPRPLALAQVSSGANIGSPSIRKVDFKTNFISAVASLPVGAYANALAVDASGNIYVAFWNKFMILRLDAGLGYLASTIAGSTSATVASTATNGPATSSGLGIIGGLALDQARGYLYASDSSNSLLYRINLASGTLSIAAGVIGASSLGQPRGIDLNLAGDIYIAGMHKDLLSSFSCITTCLSYLYLQCSRPAPADLCPLPLHSQTPPETVSARLMLSPATSQQLPEASVPMRMAAPSTALQMLRWLATACTFSTLLLASTSGSVSSSPSSAPLWQARARLGSWWGTADPP